MINNMYRFVILSFVLVSALAAVDKKECEKLFDIQVTRCCTKTSDMLDKLMNKPELKECFKIVGIDPVSCEHDRCLAKNRGLALDDNTIDKKKLEEGIAKDFGDDADLVNDIKTICIDGDISKYGPKDSCEFFKMKQCISVQILKRCPEWKQDGPCKKNYQGLIQECIRTYF